MFFLFISPQALPNNFAKTQVRAQIGKNDRGNETGTQWWLAHEDTGTHLYGTKFRN